MKLQDIENSLKKYTDTIYTTVVHNDKLKKDLLLVASGGKRNKIMIFDETKGFDEIGTIMYSIHNKSVFLSEFEVNSDFQQKGIGRLMFEVATAHSDYYGASLMFGTALPTNAIKGIGGHGTERYERERICIMEIYKRLGCNFDIPKNKLVEDKVFEQRWKKGEKYKTARKEVRHIVDQLVEHEKNHNL